MHVCTSIGFGKDKCFITWVLQIHVCNTSTFLFTCNCGLRMFKGSPKLIIGLMSHRQVGLGRIFGFKGKKNKLKYSQYPFYFLF